MKKIILCLLMLTMLWGCAGEVKQTVPDTNGDGRLTCTLEIRCDTLLTHLDELPAGKAALVPSGGVLLETVEVDFSAGETVFDVFRRILREKKIHFEYTDAQLYGSVYVEGIGNLYEFDCGPRSGWMFSVNGIFPGLGCSGYSLADGDAVVFCYTCDLGEDLGVSYEE